MPAPTVAFYGHLEYTIVLQKAAVELSLRVTNLDVSAFSFTGCLHTYLGVPDSRQLELRGLQGFSYDDKVRRDEDESGVGGLDRSQLCLGSLGWIRRPRVQRHVPAG